MFTPTFAGPIEGYVHNFLKRNYWRVRRSMEYEDCLQEARLLFEELKLRYPSVDQPQWFMSLFKTSWYHHFSDLATSDTSIRTAVKEADISTDDGTPSSVVADALGETDNAGYTLVLIKQAPEDIRRFFSLLLNAPTEMLEMVTLSSGKRNERQVSEMLCKMLGLSAGTNILQKVRDYLAE